MENATKAIVMAGAVLIGIIIISVGVLLWRNYSEFSANNSENIRNQQLSEFNVKFQKYNYNENEKNYATAQDVRTIVNLVKDYNEKYNQTLVQVVYNNSSAILSWDDKRWIDFLEEANKSQDTGQKIVFKVNVSDEGNDIVSKISIIKKEINQ